MTGITPATPVAISGGGPVGLAAAAHLAERGLPFLVLEAGPEAGHSVLSWGHVQLFSPWRYSLDRAAVRLLEPTGWQAPDPEAYPTGRALVEQYLTPLAAHPAIAPHLRLNTRVTAITREGVDKLSNAGREAAPFLLHITCADGSDELSHPETGCCIIGMKSYGRAPAASSCCALTVQATCCEPGAKAECCGVTVEVAGEAGELVVRASASESSCGCQ